LYLLFLELFGETTEDEERSPTEIDDATFNSICAMVSKAHDIYSPLFFTPAAQTIRELREEREVVATRLKGLQQLPEYNLAKTTCEEMAAAKAMKRKRTESPSEDQTKVKTIPDPANDMGDGHDDIFGSNVADQDERRRSSSSDGTDPRSTMDPANLTNGSRQPDEWIPPT
jgi:hypothetical protein